MEIQVTIFLSILLFFSSFGLALLYAQPKKGTILLPWALLAIGLLYGLGWVCVVLSTGSGSFLGQSWIPAGRGYYLLFNLLGFALLFGVVVGWSIRTRLNAKVKFLASNLSSLDEVHLLRFSWFVLILSFFIRWVYVSAFGGFVSYLDYASSVRSAVFVVHNPWSFLQPFGGLSIFSFYMFFSILFLSDKVSALSFVRKLSVWTGFLCSLIFSVYILYSYMGRVNFIVFIFVITLSIFYFRGVSLRFLITGSLVGVVAGLWSIYLISNYFDVKGGNDFSLFVAREISFPFVTFFSQLLTPYLSPRFFVDILISPLNLLPSSWLSTWYIGPSEVNTIIISGAAKGTHGVTGGIPVDLLSLGFMQLGVAGVLVIGIMFGLLLRFFQYFFDGILVSGFKHVLLAFATLQIAFLPVAYAQPAHLIAAIFPMVVVVCLMYLYSVIRRIKLS